MTPQTIQPRSWALLNEPGKDLTIDKSETEDNRELFLRVFDSMNNLYEKLNRLVYVVQKKKLEAELYRESKGE